MPIINRVRTGGNFLAENFQHQPCFIQLVRHDSQEEYLFKFRLSKQCAGGMSPACTSMRMAFKAKGKTHFWWFHCSGMGEVVNLKYCVHAHSS
mgnify:CR=1 FL=1